MTDPIRTDERSIEQALGVFLYNSPFGVVLVDMQRRIRWANKNACDLMGVAGREDVVGVPCWQCLSKVPCGECPVLDKGDALDSAERMVRRRDGVDIPTLKTVTRIDVDGEPMLLETFVDISRQKRQQQEIAESRRGLEQVLNGVGVGIAVIDPSMRILSMNKTMSEWFPDVDPETRPTCYRAYNNPPSDGPCSYCPTLKAMRDGRTHEAMTETPTPEGMRYFRVTATPLFDAEGRVTAAIETVDDLTPINRANAQLTQALEEQHAIFESSLVGIMVLENRIITKVNGRMAEILGYKPEEILNRGPQQLHLSMDHFHDFGEKYYWRLAENNLVDIEYPLRHKDGRTVWCQFNGRAIAPPDMSKGAVWIIQDVTQRRLAQEELRQAKEQAEAAARSKGEFLANMSHEIRTPMTAVLGFAELLTESLECCTTCPQHNDCQMRNDNREYVNTICASGRHLLDLINDILDLSKIEAGKLSVERTPTRLVDVVSEVASMLRLRASSGGIELRVEFPTELPETVVTDRARLRQSLVNLIGNAIKFTEAGWVAVRTSLLPSWRGGAPAVCFEIEDTGMGIEPEAMSKLFAAFEQADTSASRRFGGTGLGLAITRRLVELLGGQLTAESVFGKGSVFRMTLPVGDLAGVAMLKRPSEAIRETREAPRIANEESVPLAGVRVLLAEDAEANRRLLCAVLGKAGAEVETAVNGAEAVRMLERDAFDVVLMDMQMPEMDGYQAARTLRARGYDGAIVALTAHTMSGDREKCVAAGCDDHTAKPIDRQALIAKVAQWAGRTAGGTAAAPAGTDEPAADAPGPLVSELADDPDMADLVDHFVEQLPGMVDPIVEAVEVGDFDRARSLAHQLKGAGGGYGYPCLTDAAAAIEQAAGSEDPEAARLALTVLTSLSEAVVDGHASAVRP